MSAKQSFTSRVQGVSIERIFDRFTRPQRLEHIILILCGLVLFLTGVTQKYRATAWSQTILATPERVETIQDIHHIAAVILILEVIYHLGKIITQIARRRLSGDMLITWQDFKDALSMLRYLLFFKKTQPRFGKYNFEQKVTYWFLFVGIGIMVITGLIIWFPVQVTQVLPGAVVPAAKLAHSDEAIVAAVFVILWHLYHVLVERLNLSMFTGWLNEKDMRTYHALEYERLTGESAEAPQTGADQP